MASVQNFLSPNIGETNPRPLIFLQAPKELRKTFFVMTNFNCQESQEVIMISIATRLLLKRNSKPNVFS